MADEAEKIDHYVEEHMDEWQNLSSEVLRIPKEESGLPRTIHVFRAFGRLCIQVLCKTKNNLQIVGQGTYKKGKISVEWRTKTLWTEYNVHAQNDWDVIKKGLEKHDIVGCQPSIFPSPKGSLIYQKKDHTQTYSFFGPLRDGDAAGYLTELRQQKMSITGQVLHILDTLERHNITHNDMKTANFFIYIDDANQIQIELGDFDFAQSCPVKLKDYRQDCWGYDKTKGDFQKTAQFLELIYQEENSEIQDLINKLKAIGNSDSIHASNYSASQLLTVFKSLAA